MSAVEFDFDRNTAAQPLDPRQGYVVHGHVEKAGRWLRGTFDYTEFSAKCAGMCRLDRDSYGPTGRVRGRWPGRAPRSSRSTSAISSVDRRSVRGWGRYQVSPLTPAGEPIGGRTMLEVSTEARFGISGKLGAVLFVDGGNAWEGPGRCS